MLNPSRGALIALTALLGACADHIAHRLQLLLVLSLYLVPLATPHRLGLCLR